jgi:hypothetical protein
MDLAPLHGEGHPVEDVAGLTAGGRLHGRDPEVVDLEEGWGGRVHATILFLLRGCW